MKHNCSPTALRYHRNFVANQEFTEQILEKQLEREGYLKRNSTAREGSRGL